MTNLCLFLVFNVCINVLSVKTWSARFSPMRSRGIWPQHGRESWASLDTITSWGAGVPFRIGRGPEGDASKPIRVEVTSQSMSGYLTPTQTASPSTDPWFVVNSMCICVSMLHTPLHKSVFNTTWVNCQEPFVPKLTPCHLLPGWICCRLPLVSLLSHNITDTLNRCLPGSFLQSCDMEDDLLFIFRGAGWKIWKWDTCLEMHAMRQVCRHTHTPSNPKNVPHILPLCFSPGSSPSFLFLLSPLFCVCSDFLSIHLCWPAKSPSSPKHHRPRSFTSGGTRR